eukprot:28515-Chlamydomonas_euryale.AAC.4
MAQGGEGGGGVEGLAQQPARWKAAAMQGRRKHTACTSGHTAQISQSCGTQSVTEKHVDAYELSSELESEYQGADPRQGMPVLGAA